MKKQTKHLCMAGLILIIFFMLFQKTNNIEGFSGSTGYAGLLGWPSLSQDNNTQNIAIIKNAIKGKDLGDKMIGGWVQAAYGHNSLWGSDSVINTLLPGGFQSDPSIMPGSSVKGSKNTYLTLGGDGVGGLGACSTGTFIQTVADWVNQNDCTGICFDTEGCYGGTLDDTVKNLTSDFIPELESKIKKSLKYILCPPGDIDSGSIPSREDCSKFDLLAPMLYYGDTTYDKKNISDITGWIQNWKTAGWKESEIILTYQSTSAATSSDGPKVLNNLAAMLIGADPGPAPPAPPKPPTPPGPGPGPGPGPPSSTQRCGKDWSDANSNCHTSCTGPQDCDPNIFGTNNCYANLDKCKDNTNNNSKMELADKLFT